MSRITKEQVEAQRARYQNLLDNTLANLTQPEALELCRINELEDVAKKLLDKHEIGHSYWLPETCKGLGSGLSYCRDLSVRILLRAAGRDDLLEHYEAEPTPESVAANRVRNAFLDVGENPSGRVWISSNEFETEIRVNFLSVSEENREDISSVIDSIDSDSFGWNCY